MRDTVSGFLSFSFQDSLSERDRWMRTFAVATSVRDAEWLCDVSFMCIVSSAISLL